MPNKPIQIKAPMPLSMFRVWLSLYWPGMIRAAEGPLHPKSPSNFFWHTGPHTHTCLSYICFINLQCDWIHALDCTCLCVFTHSKASTNEHKWVIRQGMTKHSVTRTYGDDPSMMPYDPLSAATCPSIAMLGKQLYIISIVISIIRITRNHSASGTNTFCNSCNYIQCDD